MFINQGIIIYTFTKVDMLAVKNVQICAITDENIKLSNFLKPVELLATPTGVCCEVECESEDKKEIGKININKYLVIHIRFRFSVNQGDTKGFNYLTYVVIYL